MIRFLWAALRIALGAMFVYAGAVKAWDPSGFLSDIEGYQILPYKLAVVAAVYLPWLEIVCGLALVMGRFLLDGSLAITTGLMGIFTAALIWAWWRGLDISCGCFGASDSHVNYGWLITRDLILLGALVAVWWAKRLSNKSTSQSRV